MAAGVSSSRIGPGRAVLIVGPSGAGKDAVLQEVRRRLADDPRFCFPRRVVTRASSAAEDHASVSPGAFAERLAAGGFTLHWEAHGLRYGIPAEVDGALHAGHTAVFNASRQAVPAARARFAAAQVVLIDAPLQVRAARLAGRKRERPDEVRARLERSVAGFGALDCDLLVDNRGPLEQAVARLIAWLQALDAAAG